jgi:hypothetical protein
MTDEQNRQDRIGRTDNARQGMQDMATLRHHKTMPSTMAAQDRATQEQQTLTENTGKDKLVPLKFPIANAGRTIVHYGRHKMLLRRVPWPRKGHRQRIRLGKRQRQRQHKLTQDRKRQDNHKTRKDKTTTRQEKDKGDTR